MGGGRGRQRRGRSCGGRALRASTRQPHPLGAGGAARAAERGRRPAAADPRSVAGGGPLPTARSGRSSSDVSGSTARGSAEDGEHCASSAGAHGGCPEAQLTATSPDGRDGREGVRPRVLLHATPLDRRFRHRRSREETTHGAARPLDRLHRLRARERAGAALHGGARAQAPLPPRAREGRRPDRLREGLQARGEARHGRPDRQGLRGLEGQIRPAERRGLRGGAGRGHAHDRAHGLRPLRRDRPDLLRAHLPRRAAGRSREDLRPARPRA